MRAPDRPSVAPPDPHTDPYAALLDAARQTADAALNRVRRLSARFPADVPTTTLEQLERAHADPGAERRAWVRLPGGPEVLVRTHTPSSAPLRARLLDRSAGGFAVLVDRPLPEGAVVAVRQFGAEGAAVWISGVVRSCRAVSGGWAVGCQIIENRATPGADRTADPSTNGSGTVSGGK